LSLYLQIDDINEFASNYVTDGGNDKKIDICYFDEESQHLIIVQSYISKGWNRQSALDKASDLDIAIAWLFSANIADVPIDLQTRVVEIRNAIAENEIRKIELLYIHNCPESANISDELKTATALLRDVLKKDLHSFEGSVEISYKEFGLNQIESLYKSKGSQIIIDSWISVPTSNLYLEEKKGDWKAILTSVPASWIHDLYREHGDNLFSADYRGYLGSNDRENNINRQIVETAEGDPINFWVFNNGITALTNQIDFKEKEQRIQGISIINGAQTTGALGNTSKESTQQARVLLRIISCNSAQLIDDIILYNNTQNAIKPEDIRSKDPRQNQIQQNFALYKIHYSYRRNEKRVSKNSITDKSVAAAICAFHGNPQVSFRNPKKIFKDDDTYNMVFPNNICVEHIFLIRSLSIAIDEIKQELKEKNNKGTETEQDRKQLKFLKYSASKHFVFFLVGFLAEEIMNTRATNIYEWKCKKEFVSIENKSLIFSWKKVLQAMLPNIIMILEKQGEEAYYDVPRSDKKSREVATELKTLLSSLEPVYRILFMDLRKRTSI
jgi:hypothetical protein